MRINHFCGIVKLDFLKYTAFFYNSAVPEYKNKSTSKGEWSAHICCEWMSGWL